MKGPKLDISTPAREINAYLRQLQKEKDGNGEEKEPTKPVDEGQTYVDVPDKACKHEVGAQIMCNYFNFMFGTLKNYYTSTVGAPHVTHRIMRPLGQTFIQGMTTRSGCCFLYTHEVGIAFEMMHLDENGQIVIRVSPLLCCQNENGPVAGILALSHYSIKNIEEDEEFADKVMKFFEKIDASARERDNIDDEKSDHSKFEGASGSTDGPGGGPSKKKQKTNKTLELLKG